MTDTPQDAPVRRNAKFLTGSTMRHVVVMALSAAAGLMAVFLVDLVDYWFLSQLGDEKVQSAVSPAGTILFGAISLSVGLMIAGIALTSRAIGAGDEQKAKEMATAATVYITALLGLFGIISAIYAKPILQFLGAEGHTLELAYDYSVILLVTMPLMGLIMITSGLMRAAGDAKRSAWVTGISGIVNAALDPIFIFTLDMGIEGAAIASALARLVAVVYGVWCMIKIHDLWIMPKWCFLKGALPPYMAIALPAVLTNIATPFSNGWAQTALSDYGDGAMAAWSFISRLVPVAFGALFALSGAVGPIIGQNYGAGQMDRVRQAYVDGLKFAIYYTIGIAAILIILRYWLTAQFELTDEAMDLSLSFIVIACPLFLFNGLLFVSNAAFNTLGYAKFATFFNWGRASLGTIPFIILGGSIAGAQGIIIGHAVGAIPFGILAVFTAWRVIKNLEPPSKG